MCLVSISIFVPLGATNTYVRTLLDEAPKDIQEWFLISVGQSRHVEYALCPKNIVTSPMLVHRQVGV